MKRTVFRNPWLPYFLVLPQVVVTLVFFFWPAFDSLRLSLFQASPFGDKLIFIGLQNFERLLTSPDYHRSIVNSFIFAFGVTLGSLTLSLILAVLANQKLRGLAFYRTALLWPYGIAPAVAGIIWLFIFHPAYGIMPYLLSFITTYEFNWLLKGWIAMLLITVASIWKQLGYNMAFFLAGLQTIPTALLEAASVDGAGPVRRFWLISFPLLSPITFFLLIINIVFAFFETFGIIHAVTHGGPGDATEILVYKAYKDGFINLKLGSSAAQSVILMVLVVAMTLLQFRYTEKKVAY
jgi:sn-glycerol 3-phosphate transport system permease protein